MAPDPNTGDLVRLTVRTSERPVDLGSCQATTTLDYSRIRIHNLTFLLPREAQLDILNADGSEWRNHTVFSSCHEFLGQSTLSFDGPPPEASAAAQGKASTPRPLTLPAGLQFKLQFTQPIDTETAAAGDRIKAKLQSAIRDASSKILVPAGSEVTAHIVKLEHFSGPPSSVRILVKLETVNSGGTLLAFAATTDGVVQPAVKVSRGLQRRIQLGSFDTLADPKAGVFEFPDVEPNFVVRSGLESIWLTAGPE